MANISRNYSFSDGMPLVNSQLESEIFNIVNTWNNHNQGILKWDKVALSSSGGLLSVPSSASQTFTSASGLLSSYIKYTINNFTIGPDATNGLWIVGETGIGAQTPSFGSGAGGMLFLSNASAEPSADPTNGGLLFVGSQVLKYRGATGTKRTVSFLEGNQTFTGIDTFSGQLIGKGTATNDDAAAGYIGEYIESLVSATNTGASGQYFDATSISLTAGDWDVTGIFQYSENSATLTTLYDIESGISTTTGNSVTGLVLGKNYVIFQAAVGFGVSNGFTPLIIPSFRMKLGSPTTVYLKGYPGTFSAGSPQYACRLSARRVR